MNSEFSWTCPKCSRQVPNRLNTCRCGYQQGTSPTGTAERLPTYYPVSPYKFVILSVLTLGAYQIYWFYKNWAFIRERDHSDIWPWARALFAPLFFDSLSADIKKELEGEHAASGTGLWLSYVLLNAAWGLPDPFSYLGVLTFVPLLPSVNRINTLNRHQREISRTTSMEIQFSAGSVLSRTFAVWWRNLVPFATIAFLVHSPFIIATALYGLTAQGDSNPVTPVALVALAMTLGPVVAQWVLSGAVIFGVLTHLQGNEATVRESLRVGLRYLFPILLVSILQGIITFGGMLLLVIPGLIAMCTLWVAVPVTVTERPGIWASIKRSSELTRGDRRSVFSIIMVLAILGFVGSSLLQGVALAISGPQIAGLVAVLTQALLGTLGAVAMAVGYHDLRVSKEGVNTDSLVEVFA